MFFLFHDYFMLFSLLLHVAAMSQIRLFRLLMRYALIATFRHFRRLFIFRPRHAVAAFRLSICRRRHAAPLMLFRRLLIFRFRFRASFACRCSLIFFFSLYAMRDAIPRAMRRLHLRASLCRALIATLRFSPHAFISISNTNGAINMLLFRR